MADGSIIIEVKGDAEELERALKNVSRSADTLEDAVKDVASAFKKVESAADDVDGDGLKDAARDADKLDRELDEAAQSAGKLGDKLGSGFTVARGVLANLASEGIQMVASGLVDLASEAITAADSLTKFESTMDFAGFGAQEIDALTQSVQDYASKTVYDLETIANTTAQLGANGVKDFMALTEAAGNLNAVAGGNADTFKSVSMVLTQTAGAGKLTTENWNQLADAIPGASGVLQEAMKKNGAYTGDFRDAMAKGEITAEEFNQAIMELGFEDAAIEAASSTKTIEGAFGNLKATVVDGFVAALTDGGLMNGITGFINGLATVLSNAGQYIGPAMDSIKGSIQGVKDAFANAFTGEQQAAILDFLSTFASALVALPFQIVAVGVEIITTAFELLITAAGAVVEFFTTTLPNGIQTTIEWFQELPGKISEAINNAFTAINNWAADVVETMSTKASEAVEAVVRFFQELPGKVTGFLEGAMTAIKTWAKDMVETMSTKASEAIDAVVRFFQELPGKITEAVNNAMTAIRTWAKDMVETMGTKAGEAVDAVVRFLSNLPGEVARILTEVVTSVVTWGGNMVTSAQTAITNVVRTIAETLSGAISRVTSIGGQIVQGLASGILGGVSTVINAAVSVVTKAIAAAKSALGIHSPSRVFMGIGDQTVDGLTIGLKKNTKHAADAAAGAASAVTDSFSSKASSNIRAGFIPGFADRMKRAVESETVSISSVLGSRVGESGGISNHYGGTTINIYVDGAKAETPQQARDLGRELGGELNREMRRRGLVPA